MPKTTRVWASSAVAVLITSTTAVLLGTPRVLSSSFEATSSPTSSGLAASQPADFNGDGFSDLAVGVPFESVGDIFDTGALNVLYGSAAGLASAGSQFWHQDSSGVGGDGAEEGDNFGDALASGDFNGDGFADLAVGVPGEWVGAVGRAGAVNVLYGSDAGLIALGSQFWHQDSLGVKGRAEEEDAFGTSLASDDFNGDGFSDLAVGVPYEAVGAIEEAGVVNVLYGTSAGLSTTGNQLWHQNSPGVKGTAASIDNFGWSLATGNFGKSSQAELAVGVPGDSPGGRFGAGAVNVLYGSSTGLTEVGDQLWAQNSPGISGTAEDGDSFGWSLASADFNGVDGSDLAVGVLFEDVGRTASAGAVNVLYGSTTGLTAAGNQLWHQNSLGVSGFAEAEDQFGSSLTAADFGKSLAADLAIGVRLEDVGSLADAGAVNVLYGSTTGLTAAGDQLWDQNSPGVEDAAEEGDCLGWSLAAGSFGNSSQGDLAMGVTCETLGEFEEAGAVNVLYGSMAGLSAVGNQFWNQDSPGVAGDGADGPDAFSSGLAPRQ